MICVQVEDLPLDESGGIFPALGGIVLNFGGIVGAKRRVCS